MNDMDAKARALFERSVEQLDEATVRRLRLARRSTLAAPAAPRWRGWPAGLAAAAVLALGLAWWLPPGWSGDPTDAYHARTSAAPTLPFQLSSGGRLMTFITDPLGGGTSTFGSCSAKGRRRSFIR